jgi:Dyp-type peroxidase family
VQPLRKNGTFTVVRKLEQKVEAFNRYLRDASKGIHGGEEWVAARIVGRWRSDGSPLVKFPNAPKGPDSAEETRNGGSSSGSDKAPDNDFRYGQDPLGATCPLGAHIRRTNPRDAFGWEGRPTKRHRIIRRGMPYVQERAKPDDHEDQEAEQAGESVERGLMFVCHQASIERQFEVIQHQWLNDGDAFWLGAEPDLLTSGSTGKGMTIHGEPPKFLPKPEPFIVTKGGGYFFTPGIAALRNIAAAGWL